MEGASLLGSSPSRYSMFRSGWDEEVAPRMEDLKAGKAVTVACEQLHRELPAMGNDG